MSFLNVGITGINAAQASLRTSAHNIANASTPGFNRQFITQTTNAPTFTGAGFIGQGTRVETIQRVYSDLLTQQVRAAETNVAELTSHHHQIRQIDDLLADPSGGLSPALQSFFRAVSEAAANPASIPARQALLSGAQSLVARFNAMDQQLSSMRNGTNAQIISEVQTINAKVQEIANLNDRILVAQAAAAKQPANDLFDQRDKLIAELNKGIRITTQTQEDGAINLFFGNGQPLIVGTNVYRMTALPSTEDLTHMEVAITAPSGELLRLPESMLSGGTLGGLLRFRSETLDLVQNNLGRIVQSVVAHVNAQHRLGQTLAGAPAGDFFQPQAPGILGAPANRGDLALDARIIVSDYRVEYDGVNYNVTRLADNHRFDPMGNFPLVVDGVRFDLTAGTPMAGDTFIIRPGQMPADRVTKIASSSNAVVTSTGSHVQTLADSDYRLTLTDAHTMTLTRLSDDTHWVGIGTTQSEALRSLMERASPLGFSLEIASGIASIGDSFLIRPSRDAARDMRMAITDPRDVAAAQGFSTSASPTNAGTGTISAGLVEKTDVPLSAPVRLVYEAATQSLVGFPVGATVMVGLTKHLVTEPNQRIPHVSGATVSFGGTAFSITGIPDNDDVFIINPPPTDPSASNHGLAALFGTPAPAGNAATGSIVPATASMPLRIVAGANDSFMISIDGGLPVLVRLNEGSYTPTQLLSALNAQPTMAGATADFDTYGQLVITSTNPAGSISLSQALPNTGAAVIDAEVPQGSHSSLPAQPITLTFRLADPAASPALPARLTGFPVGSTVMQTLPDGTTREYRMNSADGFTDAASFADFVPYVSGATIRVNGMRFEISGSPADGDQFELSPNPAGTGDNRNMQQIAALQLANTMSDGMTSFQGGYSWMVSLVGNQSREIQVTLTAQETLAKKGNDAIQSMSGVNLDEEAANLLRFQQAYQAAAKMMEISSRLFDTILAMGR